MDEAQIKHMVDRFLAWKLPADFSPDAGISYVRPTYAAEVDPTPCGTNLLDARQAEAMVRHLVEGLPASLTAASASPGDGWDWGIVEVFGHRKHAGRVREEERFGSKMMRIDVPLKGDPVAHGWTTHWYGGASIFSYTLTDEATALRINKPYEPAARYALPAPDDEGDDGELFP